MTLAGCTALNPSHSQENSVTAIAQGGKDKPTAKVLTPSAGKPVSSANLQPLSKLNKDTILHIYTAYADADQILVNATIESLHEKNPSISFVVEPRTGMDGGIIKTRAAVGELPDIIEGSQMLMASLRLTNDLYPLENSILKLNLSSSFQANTLVFPNSADGHIYGVSYNETEPMQFYYNRSLFTRLGLPPPSNYESLVSAVSVLKDNRFIPLTMYAQEKWVPVQLLDMAAVAENPTGLLGGEASQTNPSATHVLRAAEKLQELLEMGLLDKDVLTTDTTRAYKLFRNGQAGMLFDGRWYLRNTADYIDEIGILPGNPFADANNGVLSQVQSSGGIPTMTYMISNIGVNEELKASVFFDYLAERARQSTRLFGTANILTEEVLTELPSDNLLRLIIRQSPQTTSKTRFAWDPTNAKLREPLENIMGAMLLGNLKKEDLKESLLDAWRLP